MLICKTIIYMSMTSYQLKITKTKVMMMTLTSHKKPNKFCRSGMLIPDPGFWYFSIPDPGSPKQQNLQIWDVYPSRIWFFPPRIPDPRYKIRQKRGKISNKQSLTITKLKLIFFLNRYRTLRNKDWGSWVQDPVSENTHNGSRIRIQGSNRHGIPDRQHGKFFIHKL